MKIDIHMTTCHRSDVKCRPRSNDYNVDGFNITEWTPEERLEMSKISLASLRQFVESLPDKHTVRISLLDDGSDYKSAIKWLKELGEQDWLEVYLGEASGSAHTINKYSQYIPQDTDLILHVEDDQIFFNPDKEDWAQLCWDILNHPDASNKVIAFRSGLPTQEGDPGLNGAWGPIGSGAGDRLIYFNFMGNSHHVMRYVDYIQMLPLSGNTGGCEAQMNRTLINKKWRNAELQEPIYVFHTHKLSDKLPKHVTTDVLNQTGKGIEYGLKDIHEHLSAGKPISCTYYRGYPGNKKDVPYAQGSYYYVDTLSNFRRTEPVSKATSRVAGHKSVKAE